VRIEAKLNKGSGKEGTLCFVCSSDTDASNELSVNFLGGRTDYLLTQIPLYLTISLFTFIYYPEDVIK
jgi:hypothetical protein